MSLLRTLQRDSYLLSRTIGDVDAARRGTLPKRLVKRWYHRNLISLFRKGGIW